MPALTRDYCIVSNVSGQPLCNPFIYKYNLYIQPLYIQLLTPPFVDSLHDSQEVFYDIHRFIAVLKNAMGHDDTSQVSCVRT